MTTKIYIINYYKKIYDIKFSLPRISIVFRPILPRNTLKISWNFLWESIYPKIRRFYQRTKRNSTLKAQKIDWTQALQRRRFWKKPLKRFHKPRMRSLVRRISCHKTHSAIQSFRRHSFNSRNRAPQKNRPRNKRPLRHRLLRFNWAWLRKQRRANGDNRPLRWQKTNLHN